MEKTCSKCGFPKNETEFSWKNKAKGTRQSRCKTCVNKHMKNDYENNKTYYLDKNRKSSKRRTEYLRELRAKTPCADCKNLYPYYIMEFDHVDNKEDNVTTLATCSWKRMLNELNKCDIVCANCHRTRTHRRRVLSSQGGI